MRKGAGLAVFVAGVAAAVFVAWPGFSINREGQWRSVLAGFQLQRESGDFIGASSALIHFHGLDGRPGRVRFTVGYRILGESPKVYLAAPGGVRLLALDAGPAEVEVPFGGAKDLELMLEAIASPNPRPLRVSNLRLDRNLTLGVVGLSLLPLLFGTLVWATLSRLEPSQDAGGSGAALSIFTIAAGAWLVVTALDPVRALSFDSDIRGALPFVFALGFGLAGVLRPGLVSAALALSGAILSLHIHTVHSGFVYDDRLWARPWTLAEIASTFVGSEDPRGISGTQYRPIPSITHALDYALWGPSPFAFHLVNMALHALSAFLLLVLLQRLKLARMPAFLGALAFAIHPLAASSIGWISERTDTLTDIFILSTLVIFLGPKGARPLVVLGVALLALWSKETAVMLPPLAVLFAVMGLTAEQRRARYATLRSLFAFVVLYVVVWVSLFPEKMVDRLQTTPQVLPSGQNGWLALWGSLFSQLFHPMGFEVWRKAQDSVPVAAWVGATTLMGMAFLAASFYDRRRALAWRLAGLGIAFSALVVIPFRGPQGVDVYRLGHSPTIGFGIFIAGLAAVLTRESRWRSVALAALLIARFGPEASRTSAAWGYPGFQFEMALRFNRENPYFIGGLDPGMKTDLERESHLEDHRNEPLKAPFEP